MVLLSVLFNLALLFFFKYFDFVIENLRSIRLFSSLKPLGLTLPIGISFYTFQTMSYTIDIYRGEARAQRNFVTFGTFVTLFPQLIAGPILQYRDLDDQLRERSTSVSQFASGVEAAGQQCRHAVGCVQGRRRAELRGRVAGRNRLYVPDLFRLFRLFRYGCGAGAYARV